MHLSQLAILHHLAGMLDGRSGPISRVVVLPLLQLLVLGTAPLRVLFVPLVDEGVVQVLVAAGTLGDDAEDVEIGGVVVGTVELVKGREVSVYYGEVREYE